MNLIIQTMIIAYLFLLVPFHFGILWTSVFVKRKRTVSEIMTDGYLSMMAVFCILAVLSIQKGSLLSELAVIWLSVCAAVSVLVNVFCWKRIREFVTAVITFWKKREHRNLVFLAVLMTAAILFTRPSALDSTLEIVQTAVETNTMYVYDAYTGVETGNAMTGHAYAPIEMLYAAAGNLTKIEIPLFLYYFVPISFIGFFYLGIWRMGNQLIEDKKYCVPFIWIVTVIYWMTTYLEGQSVVTGIFLNCWNGLTLLSCVIMPIAFGELLNWIEEAAAGRIENKIEKIAAAVLLLLAGQLTDEKGGFYIGLMFVVSITVVIVRKGYDYGITSGRFKKRV